MKMLCPLGAIAILLWCGSASASRWGNWRESSSPKVKAEI